MTDLQNNYHSQESDKQFMSVSQYKRWIECEASAYEYYVNGNRDVYPDLECFKIGSFFHALFEGVKTANVFKSVNSSMFRKDGTPYAKYQHVLDMHKRASKDKLFMDVMTGNKEQPMTGELYGFKFKIRIDNINFDKRFFTDLKSCADFNLKWSAEHGDRVPFYETYNYWLQIAVYREIIHQNMGHYYEPYIAAVTKQKPPRLKVISFESDHRFSAELDRMGQNLDRIRPVMTGKLAPNRCNNCDWCADTDTLAQPELAISYQ